MTEPSEYAAKKEKPKKEKSARSRSTASRAPNPYRIGVMNHSTGRWESRSVVDMHGQELRARLRKNTQTTVKWAETLLAAAKGLEFDNDELIAAAESTFDTALSTISALQTNRQKLTDEISRRAAEGD